MSNHPLQIGYIRRAPLVENMYTGFPVIKEAHSVSFENFYLVVF
jgi:hypothetical protein